MANVLQMVKDVLAKAGLSETNEMVAIMLQSDKVKQLESVEIDASITNIVAQKLITVDGAKSHGDVSAHFKKSYFGAIDTALKTSLQELGIPDETIAEIEKNPTDRRVSEALKKAIELKGKASNSQEIETLRNSLKSFQDQTKAEKEAYLQQIQNSKNELLNVRKNYAIDKSLSAYSFVDTLTSEQVTLLMQSEINKELAQRKAILNFENDSFVLKSAETPELDYFDVAKGKPLSYKEFLDSVVANSKLQKVADTNQKQNAGQFSNPNQTLSNNQQRALQKIAEMQSKP